MTATPTSSLPRLAAAAALASLALLAGCETPPPAPVGVTDLSDRPAERALLAALRSYDEADYPAVERNADAALKLGLASTRDQAMAHKLRAFVYCTSDRTALCEAEFRAALAVDPKFELTKAEAGHPIWGPVYLKSRQ
jgi:Tfp pilus assembly protein PilF